MRKLKKHNTKHRCSPLLFTLTRQPNIVLILFCKKGHFWGILLMGMCPISWIVGVRCPVKIRDVRPNGQMAKWPDIMSGEKFCVILRPAIYFQKSYIKRNLDGGTSTPEKLCWGISCASLFLPLFRGLNHVCENEGFCTISTRTHTGFPVSQILMWNGHKIPRFEAPLGGTA